MSCTNIDGDLAPFCLPTSDAQVTAGEQLFVSWDPDFFGDPSTLVQIQADFSPSSGEGKSTGENAFSSNALRAATGSYGWDIRQSVLGNGTDSVNAQLYIAVVSTDGSTQNRTTGPLIKVVSPTAPSSDSNGGVNIVAIIVPVVVGVLILAAIGGYLCAKRRDPGWSLKGMFGLGKTRTPKSALPVAGTREVQMTDMSMGKPQDGRNVFREEIRRQEEARI
ncbi:hypothetical protein JX265_010144 [Neoarthrinium moseri]|uniref:Uncharacterized protein n=1 Tax=Neoarthrinium moseri TaxID=1658444 RepID=A0A9Q0AKS4_9PEZI|nr:uncharacterized protein JN550_006816 [Neoarthrinium moseri]KAI1841244.1 hypothetical protein JX266_012556 [Neoarthrinium moseri]KAI1860220.1 hypothetical protein JX265_010144 [Neoarthrinium moseri]KAI1867675.1 hypothetical protein JN550_006816 [Neoarthrinium moseri]